MEAYDFVTVWCIEAPLERVFQAIYHSERWPEWWRSVENVTELEPGDGSGLGRLRRSTWKGRLPYRLTFDVRVTRIEPLALLEGEARGELEGVGCWRFSTDGRATTIRHEWRVRTTRRWMNVLAPVARPLFEWNHHEIMRQGGEGLARLLSARLVGADPGAAGL